MQSSRDSIRRRCVASGVDRRSPWPLGPSDGAARQRSPWSWCPSAPTRRRGERVQAQGARPRAAAAAEGLPRVGAGLRRRLSRLPSVRGPIHRPVFDWHHEVSVPGDSRVVEAPILYVGHEVAQVALKFGYRGRGGPGQVVETRPPLRGYRRGGRRGRPGSNHSSGVVSARAPALGVQTAASCEATTGGASSDLPSTVQLKRAADSPRCATGPPSRPAVRTPRPTSGWRHRTCSGCRSRQSEDWNRTVLLWMRLEPGRAGRPGVERYASSNADRRRVELDRDRL